MIKGIPPSNPREYNLALNANIQLNRRSPQAQPLMTEDFITQTYLTAALAEPLRQQIIALCTDAFEGREDFSRLFEYIPAGVHVLGYQAGRPVSHGVFAMRWMQINHGPLLRCAYVDAVATLPDQQRKGYGAAVMRRLAHAMIALPYEIGGLSTSTPEFYASVGWEQWRGPLAGRAGGSYIATVEDDPVMILRLSATPPLEINSDLLSIEQQGGRIW